MKNIRKDISSLVRNRTLLALVPAVVIAVGASGCISPGTGSTSFLNTAGNTTTIPGGPKAAQIIFTNQASAGSGSFNAAPGTGTQPGAGLGLQAMQLFNPDGSRLTTSSTGGTSDPNWPAWLTSVEIGISGSSNTAATNQYCANFGLGTSHCLINGVSTTCDVANTYAISEYDCDTTGGSWGSGNATGNGTQTDGVYIRANFNRANLGSTENIMVVVNYAASGFTQATQTPASCFSMGSSVPFSPEMCADFTWRAFETYGPTYSFVQPFLMLVPPMYSYANSNTVSGTTPATKQFILPFAGDSNLSTFVLGRTGSHLAESGLSPTANFADDCGTGAGDTTGTPLCAGIVFYSMTFFRI